MEDLTLPTTLILIRSTIIKIVTTIHGEMAIVDHLLAQISEVHQLKMLNQTPTLGHLPPAAVQVRLRRLAQRHGHPPILNMSTGQPLLQAIVQVLAIQI